TRGRLAVVAAGLQRNIECGSARGLPRRSQSVDLSMGLAVALVPAFAADLLITNHDRTDERIRLYMAAAALGKVDGTAHPAPIGRKHAALIAGSADPTCGLLILIGF